MPSIDDEAFQRRMVERLLETFPENVPATHVRRETGISDDTVRRWRDPDEGPSFPLREPVKSALYRWYTGGEGQNGGPAEPVPYVAGDLRRDLHAIVSSGVPLTEKSTLLLDVARTLRSASLYERDVAARIEAETAARRQAEMEELRREGGKGPPPEKGRGRWIGDEGEERTG